MARTGMTISDAAHSWVREMNVYPQDMIDELESCDPEEDVEWFCNCLDTSVWFRSNEDIYRKYLEDEISDIEDNMGFEF